MAISLTLTAAILIPTLVLVGPLLAFAFGRWRTAQRTEAVLRYFDAEQRPVLASYYKMFGLLIGLCVVGVSLCMFLEKGSAIVLVVIGMLLPAGTFLLIFGWYGLTLIAYFVSASSETVPGCCSRCDYDLRGIDGGRCPECGHVVGVAMTGG